MQSHRFSFRAVLVSLVPAVVTVVAACGSGNGGPGSPGASCAAADPCSGGFCMTTADFPGGYCSKPCTLQDPTSCPSGSVCIDDASGAPASAHASAVCYRTCAADADCGRSGYKCLEKANHQVCRNGT